jgi:hypothetical protein
MAVFHPEKNFNSSLETSALLGSTSRGAALSEGAAGLRIHKITARGRRACTITPRVTAGVLKIASESAFTRVFDGDAWRRRRTGEAAAYAIVHTT